MATLANTLHDRFSGRRTSPGEMFRLRPFPNEDVYFYSKRLDNTRVVRVADPRAPRVCWRFIAGAGAAAVLLIGMLLPSGYSLMAGYQIQTLREERDRLLNERASLELEEAKLLSPERLEELARLQRFIDPEPGRVVYLPKTGDDSLAMRRDSKQ